MTTWKELLHGMSMLATFLVGCGILSVWFLAESVGMIEPFDDPRVLGFFGGWIAIVLVACAMAIIGNTRMMRHAEKLQGEFRKLFSPYFFHDVIIARRHYLVGNYDGLNVVATWYFDSLGFHKRPRGMLYVNIPKTGGRKMHATNRIRGGRLFGKLVGWRCEENGICVGPMYGMRIEDAQDLVRRIKKSTMKLLDDPSKFAQGVGIVTGWHQFMVGKEAIKLANGDESALENLELQIPFSMDINERGISLLMDDAVKAATMIGQDLK